MALKDGQIPTAADFNDAINAGSSAAVGALTTNLAAATGGTLVNTTNGNVETRFGANESRTELVLAPAATDPLTGSEGQRYQNTTTNVYRTYRSGAWVNDDAHLLGNNLASSSGIQNIGQVIGVANLRNTMGAVGQRISLASYYTTGWAGISYPVGGGELRCVQSSTLVDDSGTVFLINGMTNLFWVRDVSGEIDAQWFGVTGDGSDCGVAVKASFDYAVKYGGTINYPKGGTVNLGQMRYSNTMMNGPAFRLIGNATTFMFDDVPPPSTLTAGQDWTNEPTLISFGADPTDYGQGMHFARIDIEGISFDYSRQVNKGGNTFATMGAGAHPTPYSKGTTMLAIWGSDRPVIKNCRFSNCWGNGLQLRHCFSPVVDSVEFYDVSANEIWSRTGNSESRDSDGSALFLWGCQY